MHAASPLQTLSVNRCADHFFVKYFSLSHNSPLYIQVFSKICIILIRTKMSSDTKQRLGGGSGDEKKCHHHSCSIESSKKKSETPKSAKNELVSKAPPLLLMPCAWWSELLLVASERGGESIEWWWWLLWLWGPGEESSGGGGCGGGGDARAKLLLCCGVLAAEELVLEVEREMNLSTHIWYRTSTQTNIHGVMCGGYGGRWRRQYKHKQNIAHRQTYMEWCGGHRHAQCVVRKRSWYKDIHRTSTHSYKSTYMEWCAVAMAGAGVGIGMRSAWWESGELLPLAAMYGGGDSGAFDNDTTSTGAWSKAFAAKHKQKQSERIYSA